MLFEILICYLRDLDLLPKDLGLLLGELGLLILTPLGFHPKSANTDLDLLFIDLGLLKQILICYPKDLDLLQKDLDLLLPLNPKP